MSALAKTTGAQANLQQQFDQHVCLQGQRLK
jgi:hypothetical protein